MQEMCSRVCAEMLVCGQTRACVWWGWVVAHVAWLVLGLWPRRVFSWHLSTPASFVPEAWHPVDRLHRRRMLLVSGHLDSISQPNAGRAGCVCTDLLHDPQY